VLLAGCTGGPGWYYSAQSGWKLAEGEPKIFVVDYPAAWCTPRESLACARRNPVENTCTIFIPKNAPDWMIAHELKHCDGYDHPI